MSDFEDFDDYATYCVYCYEEASDHEQKFGCCGENHFMTGKELKEHEKELAYIDKVVRFMHDEKKEAI